MLQGPGTDGFPAQTRGTSLYGADATAGKSRLLDVDADTGESTPIGLIGSFVEGLAFDTKAGLLYGSSHFLFTVDPATGAGTTVGAIGFLRVHGLAYDPTTDTLFGADLDTDQLLTINRDTGQGTVVGPLGFTEVEALTFDTLTGRLYGADRATRMLLRIDTATGAGSAVGNTLRELCGLAGRIR